MAAKKKLAAEKAHKEMVLRQMQDDRNLYNEKKGINVQKEALIEESQDDKLNRWKLDSKSQDE